MGMPGNTGAHTVVSNGPGNRGVNAPKQMTPPVVIIGHGESPKGRGWGEAIDQCVVIRLKNPSWQNAEDYGHRCDYMAASTETMPVMLDCRHTPIEYWAQPKRGAWAPTVEQSFRAKATRPLHILLELSNRLNAEFRAKHREPGTVAAPNVSLGLFTIYAALERLDPVRVMLVGFDNLLDPTRESYRKADRGLWVTRHEWVVEHSMIPEGVTEWGSNA